MRYTLVKTVLDTVLYIVKLLKWPTNYIWNPTLPASLTIDCTLYRKQYYAIYTVFFCIIYNTIYCTLDGTLLEKLYSILYIIIKKLYSILYIVIKTVQYTVLSIIVYIVINSVLGTLKNRALRTVYYIVVSSVYGIVSNTLSRKGYDFHRKKAVCQAI